MTYVYVTENEPSPLMTYFLRKLNFIAYLQFSIKHSMPTNTLWTVENTAGYERLVIYRCHTARFKAVQLHSSSESDDDSLHDDIESASSLTFVYVPKPLQVAKTLMNHGDRQVLCPNCELDDLHSGAGSCCLPLFRMP